MTYQIEKEVAPGQWELYIGTSFASLEIAVGAARNIAASSPIRIALRVVTADSSRHITKVIRRLHEVSECV